MSHPGSSSSTGAATEQPGDRSENPDHSNAPSRKPRSHVIMGVALATVGAAILAFSLQYFLFHPMTAADESIGPRMWTVGSWLLGGGVTLTFARPWVAVVVGFCSPVITFVLAMGLYFVLALLAATLF